MSYQALARKWRPRSFPEVVGQQHVITALTNALDNDRVHHAFLFAGTRGVGKTTLARIFAKALNCEQGVSSQPCNQCDACQSIDEGRFIDLIEVDAASRTKVDDTRELLDNTQYAPTRGRYKVYLIDEVHMLSGHSFNALLKTLEEPPPHVKFLLATTDPQKLPVTVLSRCLQFNLHALAPEQISAQLEHVLVQEKVPFDSSAVGLLTRAADGSMRDALSLLDQGIAHGGGEVREASVHDMLGTLERPYLQDLLTALAGADGRALMAAVDRMFSSSCDFTGALNELLREFHHLALYHHAPDALAAKQMDLDRYRRWEGSFAPEDIQMYYQIGLIGKRDLPLAPDLRSGFEMTMLRMLAFRPAEGAADGATPRRVEQRTADTAQNDQTRAAFEAQKWAEYVPCLNLTGLVRELAMNVAPKAVQDNVLQLILHRNHAELVSKERIDVLADAVNRRFGTHFRLEVAIGETDRETPAASVERHAEERHQSAQTAIQNDPNVKEIIKRFDAKIIPESIQFSDS